MVLQYRLPRRFYRLDAKILTGISDCRYDTVSRPVGMTDEQKPWATPIRRLMSARGWTQGDLAERAKVRENTLSETLNGRSPRMDTMERIAIALDVPLWALFVSEEQYALLCHADQTKQQLVKQEELEDRILRRLAPIIASEIAAATTTTVPVTPAIPEKRQRRA